MQYVINVNCSDKFRDEFCRAFSIDKKLSIYSIFVNYFEAHMPLKLLISTDDFDTSKYIKCADVKIGDVIRATYSTFSQKYSEQYESKIVMGKVFYIADGNMLMYRHEGDKIIIDSLEQESCSWFGDTDGYIYSIHNYIHKI